MHILKSRYQPYLISTISTSYFSQNNTKSGTLSTYTKFESYFSGFKYEMETMDLFGSPSKDW